MPLGDIVMIKAFLKTIAVGAVLFVVALGGVMLAADPAAAQSATNPVPPGVQSVQGNTGAVVLNQPQISCPVNILTTGNVTLTAANCALEVDKGTGAATTVTLPAGITGMAFYIFDGKGDATTNPITITPASGNISGAASLVISRPYGAVLLIYDGTQWQQQSPPNALGVVSGSIGGGALSAGACASTTATVTGAVTSMAVAASPNTYPGDGSYWLAYVSAANTVTVKVCAAVALTPNASTYNIRVIQ